MCCHCGICRQFFISPSTLPSVSAPARAQSLLLSFFSWKTALIGPLFTHSISTDFLLPVILSRAIIPPIHSDLHMASIIYILSSWSCWFSSNAGSKPHIPYVCIIPFNLNLALLPRRRRKPILLKDWYLSTILHGFTSQKIIVLLHTDVLCGLSLVLGMYKVYTGKC
jgi:hypothetical protein